MRGDDISVAFNSIKCIINNISVEDWKEEAQSKSSLADYVTIKENLCMESYLLDKTDFYGASLKFKLRSNTLPLDHRIKKWTPGIDGTCTLCNNGSEDVKHFLFLCQKLSKLRSEEYTKLERNLFEINRIDVWELFMGGSTDMKFKLALGSVSSTFLNLCNVIDIFDVFDRFCKSFAKRAWKLRSELKSNFIKYILSFHFVSFCTTFVAVYCINIESFAKFSRGHGRVGELFGGPWPLQIVCMHLTAQRGGFLCPLLYGAWCSQMFLAPNQFALALVCACEFRWLSIALSLFF